MNDDIARDIERLRELSKQVKKLDRHDEAQSEINGEFFILCIELVPVLLDELDAVIEDIEIGRNE